MNHKDINIISILNKDIKQCETGRCVFVKEVESERHEWYIKKESQHVTTMNENRAKSNVLTRHQKDHHIPTSITKTNG